jgi:hypothetical protein
MGEAKRRAQSDPSFGKPKRGLVISAPIEITGDTVRLKSGHPDLQELRASLLYWDKLAWPTNRAIYIGGGPDIEFLETAKILTRPQYSFSGLGSDILVRAQTEALLELDKKEPGVWSLSQGENSILVKGGTLTQDEGVALELYRAVPVPDKDVPLNEVLEFRLKRYAELQSLRLEIDELVKTINASQDPKADLERCFPRIDQNCAAALRVGSEWRFPVKLSNLKTSFDLKPFSVVRDGLLGFLGATALGATSTLVASLTGASAAAAASVKITADFGWQGLKVRDNPYRYVSQFHKELF